MGKKKPIDEFLKVKLIELKKLIQSIRYFGIFSPLIRHWISSWMVYTFVYPVARLVSQREKSIIFCDYLIRMPLKPGVFSFPNITKNKLILNEKVDWDIFIETYLRDAYDKDVLKKDLTVIDIGAHIGLYTVLAAEKVGNTGKVIAIEPAPKNYQRLKENIAINNFSNVVAVKMALSDHTGQEKLYLPSRSACNSLDLDLTSSQKNIPFIEVEVDKLDNLLNNLNIKEVDVIKIDAEGTEMPILMGAKNILKNNPNVKILVASYHYPNEVKEVQKFLRHMGFNTKVSAFDIVVTI